MKKILLILIIGGFIVGVHALKDDFQEVSLNTPEDPSIKNVSNKIARRAYYDKQFAQQVAKKEVGKQLGLKTLQKQDINAKNNISDFEEAVIVKVIEIAVPYILAIVFKELPKMVSKAVSQASSGAYNKVKSGFNWLTGRSQAPEEEVIIEQPDFDDSLFVRNY